MKDAHWSVWALRFCALVSFAVLLNVDAVWLPSSLPLIIMFIVIISPLPKIHCCVHLSYSLSFSNHNQRKSITFQTRRHNASFQRREGGKQAAVLPGSDPYEHNDNQHGIITLRSASGTHALALMNNSLKWTENCATRRTPCLVQET